jgi:hypothetical protein
VLFSSDELSAYISHDHCSSAIVKAERSATLAKLEGRAWRATDVPDRRLLEDETLWEGLEPVWSRSK